MTAPAIPNRLRKIGARSWARSHGPRFEPLPTPDSMDYPALAGCEAYANDTYLVLVRAVATAWGPARHLHVQRHDTKRVRSWRALQDIKNALFGEGAVAVEMFPAEADVVDECHHYHLWVLPAGLRLPFNLRRAYE